MATIKEIAEKVGVSTATVSNVIHGKTKKVSKDNIERIEKVLKESNYVSRGSKNALQSKKNLIIGVVVHTTRKYTNTFLSDSFYGHLIGVLEEEIRKTGYYMMLYASDEIEEIYQMVLTWNIAGLIAITFTHVEYNKLCALVQKPVVAIDLYKRTEAVCYNIGTQDEQGGYLMTNYLLECGYSNILVLGNRDVGVDILRWQGYKRAIEQWNAHIKIYSITVMRETIEKRAKQFEQITDFIKKNKDAALFCLADNLAIEVVNFFIQKGVVIPRDVGVAGYDDNPYASMCYPKLTTINQDISIKAKKSMEMLFKLLKKEEISESNLLLPVRLIIRDSTKNSVRCAKDDHLLG